jgi:hypothetical protein
MAHALHRFVARKHAEVAAIVLRWFPSVSKITGAMARDQIISIDGLVVRQGAFIGTVLKT